MLAVVLGASEWPSYPEFSAAASFRRSALDIADYLRSRNGLHLSQRNVKLLIDSFDEAPEVLRQIREFIRHRRDDLKALSMPATDLLIYYVGHGGFGDRDAFFLSIRSTHEDDPLATSITAESVGRLLREGAAGLRTYLVLDCCFAASMSQALMSGGPMGAAAAQLQDALPPQGDMEAVRLGMLPEYGTALLCASGPREAAKAPPNQPYTMFTGAMLDVLRRGDSLAPPWLSLDDMQRLVRTRLAEQFADKAVLPQVHAPQQRMGRVDLVPLFRNPARPALEPEPSRLAPPQEPIVDRLTETQAPSIQNASRPETSRKRRYFIWSAVAVLALAGLLSFGPSSQDMPSPQDTSRSSDRGETDRTVAQYREAIRLDPTDPRLYKQLGWTLNYELGKTDDAIAEYREAAKLDPTDPEPYVKIGWMLMEQQHKYNEAEAEYREAIRLKSPDARLLLVVDLILQNKLDEAVAELPDGIAMTTDGIDWRKALAVHLAGEGKMDQAIALLRDAVKLNPKDVEAQTLIGGGLALQGKLDEGIAEYREAIRIDPRYTLSYLGIGKILERQGRTSEAIAEYREAIRRNLMDSELRVILADALRSQGRTDAAIAEYKEAIRLDPKNTKLYFALGMFLAEVARKEETPTNQRNYLREACDALAQGARISPANLNYTTQIREVDGMLKGDGHCPAT